MNASDNVIRKIPMFISQAVPLISRSMYFLEGFILKMIQLFALGASFGVSPFKVPPRMFRKHEN